MNKNNDDESSTSSTRIHTTTVRLENIGEVDKLAKEKRWTRSTLVNVALSDYLKNNRKEAVA